MKQEEAILNCVICNHPFDWNNVEYCPNCNWQQIDYIGDMEHTAVLLRPEREAWVTKKNYNVTDFSYEGYIPALMEAMKNQFNIDDFDINYKVSPFYREWYEDDDSFDVRISAKPIYSGVARWVTTKYNPKTGCFPILIKWHNYILDEKQEDTDNNRYFITVPKEYAKTVFDSNQFPPIYLHLHFNKPKQIHAIQAYLITNNQLFTVNPIENIELLKINSADTNAVDYSFDSIQKNPILPENVAKITHSNNLSEIEKIFQWLKSINHFIPKNFKSSDILKHTYFFDLTSHVNISIPKTINLTILPNLKEIYLKSPIYNEDNLNHLISLKKKGIKINGLVVDSKLAQELAKY